MIKVLIVQDKIYKPITEEDKCYLFDSMFMKSRGIITQYFIPLDDVLDNEHVFSTEMSESEVNYILDRLSRHLAKVGAIGTPSFYAILSILRNTSNNMCNMDEFIGVLNLSTDLRAYYIELDSKILANIMVSVWKSLRKESNNELNFVDYFASLYSEVIMNEQLSYSYNLTYFERAVVAFLSLTDGTIFHRVLCVLSIQGALGCSDFAYFIALLVKGMCIELGIDIPDELTYKDIPTGIRYSKELKVWE